MGTEVLYAQDYLAQRLSHHGGGAGAFYPRRKPHHRASTTNPNPSSSCSTSYFNYTVNPNPNPNPKPCRKAVEPKRRREVSPKPAKGQQVTILKRGESLDSKIAKSFSKKGGDGRGAGGVVVSSAGTGDLIVFGTGRLGPGPAMVSRQVAVAKPSPAAGLYAGSGFTVSPSPSALPLPTFSKRKEEGSAAATAAFSTVVEGFVDQSATKGLLRLLRLE